VPNEETGYMGISGMVMTWIVSYSPSPGQQERCYKTSVKVEVKRRDLTQTGLCFVHVSQSWDLKQLPEPTNFNGHLSKLNPIVISLDLCLQQPRKRIICACPPTCFCCSLFFSIKQLYNFLINTYVKNVEPVRIFLMY